VNGEKVAEDRDVADGDVISVGKHKFVRVKLG
jgi:pSer/pThr/pTyr-binding forkhead associated (FHA) protein